MSITAKGRHSRVMPLRQKRLLLSEGIAFLITAAGAFPFHFLYELTGRSSAAALFFAVNESVWEHTKILFFPAVLGAAVQLILLRIRKESYDPASIAAAAAWGCTVQPAAVILLFYGYSGAIGRHFLAADIAVVFLAAGIGGFISYRLLAADRGRLLPAVTGLILFAALLAAELSFTFYPPRIPLFYDTQGGFYGLPLSAAGKTFFT